MLSYTVLKMWFVIKWVTGALGDIAIIRAGMG
jgi:hypothetical protein